MDLLLVWSSLGLFRILKELLHRNKNTKKEIILFLLAIELSWILYYEKACVNFEVVMGENV